MSVKRGELWTIEMVIQPFQLHITGHNRNGNSKVMEDDYYPGYLLQSYNADWGGIELQWKQGYLGYDGILTRQRKPCVKSPVPVEIERRCRGVAGRIVEEKQIQNPITVQTPR